MNLLELFNNWDDVEVYRSGTVVFSERDPGELMYVVLKGDVELSLRGEPLGAEGEGGMLGEMAMITSSGTRSATATTISKVKLARLDRDQFLALVGENTDFALHVMAVLANRLRSVHDYYTSQFAQFK